ncbi:terpene synthase family protein [Nocardia sp. CA-107356]|uniref:terpene synthase family protein n=1 Tax=Nocardia sp. CA-107356 TaxID=3239972 RepID=UPI003D93AA19
MSASPNIGQLPTYFLPVVRCPFAWKQNPCYDDKFQREVDDWVLSVFSTHPEAANWVERIRRYRFYLWQAMMFPEIDRPQLVLWSKFTALLTVIDDIDEKSLARDAASQGQIWEELREAVRRLGITGPVNPTSPSLVRTIIDVVRGMVEPMTPPIRDGFLQELQLLCRSQLVLAPVRRQQRRQVGMSLESYLKHRCADYGTAIYARAIPHMLSIDSSWNTALATAVTYAHQHMFLVNDLYSFRKEYPRYRHNLAGMTHPMTIMVVDHGMSWQAAVDELVQMIHRAEDGYRKHRDALLRRTSSRDAARYCEALEHCIAGNLRYHLLSPRYHGLDFEGEFTSRMVTCSASDEPDAKGPTGK